MNVYFPLVLFLSLQIMNGRKRNCFLFTVFYPCEEKRCYKKMNKSKGPEDSMREKRARSGFQASVGVYPKDGAKNNTLSEEIEK